jgi:pimeloyl-ACP methyl ester carboxylesterase
MTATDQKRSGANSEGLRECCYPTGNDSSHSLTLPDGRELGYAQYGSPTGHVVIYHHGLPGSRLEAAFYHDLSLELGLRIVAIDRPGIGWSTPHPQRTLLDCPKDVQSLAEHLQFESYSILGVSGGGPYALACAVSLPPSKLKCISIVCGLGPPDIGMRGADFMHQLGFPYGWKYAPVFLKKWYFSRDTFGRMDLTDEQRLQRVLSPSNLAAIKDSRDRGIMGDEEIIRLVLRSQREARAQGFDGIAVDGKTMCRDWGFRVEDIRKDLLVQLWYGKDDCFVPANHGVQIAARLGGNDGRVLLRVEDDTHASISQRWKREQLEAIAAVMRE